MNEILIYFILALIIALVVSSASYLLANSVPTSENVGTYECGFVPFTDSRQKFEVRFFLIGILFIIFDLEISLLFPWTMVVEIANYWIVVAFLLVLTVGLIFEWQNGALEWE